MSTLRSSIALVVLLMVSVFSPATAQVTPPPRIQEAEVMFDQALRAFEQNEYAIAGRRFEEVYRTFPLHQQTTAAGLMAGKAWYRAEEYLRAKDWLEAFLDAYPASGYAEDAQEVLTYIERRTATQGTRTLGILLPELGEDVLLTEPLFNAIRIAVEAYNATAEVPVRMVFRDSGGDSLQVAAALRALQAEGAEVVIGPLFTQEALYAAPVAEQLELPLVVPLDADEAVTEGRRQVFQVNPPFRIRGELMGRFAVRSLQLDSMTVVTESGNPFSQRMADGFVEAVTREGGKVQWVGQLPSTRGWYNLPGLIGADSLLQAQAVYMPVATGDNVATVSAALNGMNRMRLGAGLSAPPMPRVRILGGDAWHQLPLEQVASSFLSSYNVTFRIDARSPAVARFREDYRTLTGATPSGRSERLAFTGYDVTTFLLSRMDASPRALQARTLRSAPPFEGLALQIDFQNSQINQGMHYLRYRLGELQLLR